MSMRTEIQNRLKYEETAERINSEIDFSKVKNFEDYRKQIMLQLRENPYYQNLFGVARGEKQSGVEKLFNSKHTQRRLR